MGGHHLSQIKRKESRKTRPFAVARSSTPKRIDHGGAPRLTDHTKQRKNPNKKNRDHLIQHAKGDHEGGHHLSQTIQLGRPHLRSWQLSKRH